MRIAESKDSFTRLFSILVCATSLLAIGGCDPWPTTPVTRHTLGGAPNPNGGITGDDDGGTGPGTSFGSSLLGWWPGEGSGQDVIGGENASPTGAVSFGSGEVGEAFSFSGSSVAFEAAPVRYAGPMTIDLWVKATSIQPQFVNVFSTGLPEDYDPYLQIMFDSAGRWVMDVGSGTDEITPIFGPAMAGAWQHLAITFDGQTVRVFLNGVQSQQVIWRGASPLGLEVLKIGANRDQTYPYRGQVDEVHLFNRALTPVEIQTIYQSGTAGISR